MTEVNEGSVDVGPGPFRAVVLHTLEPSEVWSGPKVRILSNNGPGRIGYLRLAGIDSLFASDCVVDGTTVAPRFDWYQYEGH
jgi:hypothetical protein